MKIVVLDGYTLNPGDLNWDCLAKLGELKVFDRTEPASVLARAREAEILLTNKTVLGAEHFKCLPALKYVGVLATGFNVVDVEAAGARGIVVTNVPAYSTRSVAQLAWAHLLNGCQHVAEHAQLVRDGAWCRARDFCFSAFPLIELDGLTLGIVGLGRIGQAVAALAQPFGMNVIACGSARSVASPLPGVGWTSLDDLLQRSDVVSLHCPLTPATARMIHRNTLARMRRHTFLINTSRGGLIDEAALAEALNDGAIAGAGLDVLTDEPPRPDHPLLHARNCYITPHLAWATLAARKRLLITAVENLEAFLAGRPWNVVSTPGRRNGAT